MKVGEMDALYGVALSGGKADISLASAAFLTEAKCVKLLSSGQTARVQITREGYDSLWASPSYQKRVLERFQRSSIIKSAERPLADLLVEKGLLKESGLLLLGLMSRKLTEEGEAALRGLEARQGINKPRGPLTPPYCCR